MKRYLLKTMPSFDLRLVYSSRQLRFVRKYPLLNLSLHRVRLWERDKLKKVLFHFHFVHYVAYRCRSKSKIECLKQQVAFVIVEATINCEFYRLRYIHFLAHRWRSEPKK